jgi:hypothetical protein
MPVSGDIRRARANAARLLGPQLGLLRRPLLACLGTSQWVVTTWGKPAVLGTRGSGVFPAAPAPRPSYEALVSTRAQPLGLESRGQMALEWIRARPRVATSLRRVDELGGRMTRHVEDTADELHDVSEELLGRISLGTYSLLDQALAATKRAFGATAAGPEARP